MSSSPSRRSKVKKGQAGAVPKDEDALLRYQTAMALDGATLRQQVWAQRPSVAGAGTSGQPASP